MGFKDSLFKGASSAGKEVLKEIGQVAGVVKIDDKNQKINTDVSRLSSFSKKQPQGIFKQLILGSKVSKSGGSGWQKSVKSVSQKIDNSIFANKENWTREELARETIKRMGPTGADKDLRGRYFKLFHELPKASYTKKQRDELVDRIVGSKKENIIGSDLWEKKLPQIINRRKKMEADVRKAGAKNDFAGQQKEKLNLEMYNRITKGKQN
jgi:hypothetical protein